MPKDPEPEKANEEELPKSVLPDVYTDPNAVLKDSKAVWRFGRRPDYTKTRAVYADCKHSSLLLHS